MHIRLVLDVWMHNCAQVQESSILKSDDSHASLDNSIDRETGEKGLYR